MTTKTHDLVAKTGEKPDGKARWQKCGSIVKMDDGNLRIKIDAIPIVDGGWSGWLAAFDYVPDGQQKPAPAPKPAAPAAPADLDDDIPF